jgi:hypothetical protein
LILDNQTGNKAEQNNPNPTKHHVSLEKLRIGTSGPGESIYTGFSGAAPSRSATRRKLDREFGDSCRQYEITGHVSGLDGGLTSSTSTKGARRL